MLGSIVIITHASLEMWLKLRTDQLVRGPDLSVMKILSRYGEVLIDRLWYIRRALEFSLFWLFPVLRGE
jgi:hypothetical protein